MNIPEMEWLASQLRSDEWTKRHHFDQRDWGRISSTACGTVGCVAGTHMLLREPEKFLKAVRDRDSMGIADWSQAQLGLTNDEAGRLFMAPVFDRIDAAVWIDQMIARYQKDKDKSMQR